MCLAIPAKIIVLKDDQQAVIDIGGVERDISLALVPDAVVGDYVIVHVGFAISKLNEVEAQKTLQLFQQMLTQESVNALY